MAHEHEAHHANYFMVFIALCILTGMSVVADVVHFDSKIVLIVIVLAVASAKALFVMTFFMHLKFEGKWKYVLLAPTVILAMGLPLALLPDIGVHYYTVDVPQMPVDAPLGDNTGANHADGHAEIGHAEGDHGAADHDAAH